MTDAPGVQLPFCRIEDQPNQADASADAIIGRLVAKIAQLEEQLYARDFQGISDHGTPNCMPGSQVRHATTALSVTNDMKPAFPMSCGGRRQRRQSDHAHRGILAALPNGLVQHWVRPEHAACPGAKQLTTQPCIGSPSRSHVSWTAVSPACRSAGDGDGGETSAETRMAAQSIVEATHQIDATADAAVTLKAQLQAASAVQAGLQSEIASTPQQYGEGQVSKMCSLHRALPTYGWENMHSERA